MSWSTRGEGTVGERCVEAAAFAAAGDLVAVVSSRLGGNIWDGEVRLFAVKDSEDGSKSDLVHGCATTLGCSLSDVVWITDRKTVAVAGDDGNAYVLSVDKVAGIPETNEFCLQSTLAEHEDAVTALSMDRRNKRLLSSSLDGTVNVWDVTQPSSPLQTLSPKLDALANPIVWDVVCHAEGLWAATAHQDGAVRVWDYRLDGSGGCVQTLGTGSHGACLALSDAPCGSRLACGTADGTVCLLDVRKPGAMTLAIPKRPAHSGEAHAVQLLSSNSDLFVVSGGADGCVVALQAELVVADAVSAAASLKPVHHDYVRALAVRPEPASLSSRSRLPQVFSGAWDGSVALQSFAAPPRS